MVATIVFTGGPVHLVDAAGSRTDAVAVRDGRVVALGQAARALAGAGTEIVDLRGRLLVPGFQDAHVHPVFGGLELSQCDLTGAPDPAGYLDRVRGYARAHPDEEWVVGAGWAMAAFPGGTPTRQALDEALPDRPALLHNRDHHGAWVNSAALRRAGITAATPDPPDGRIERDEHGEPAGTLHEGAVRLVSSLVPASDPARLRDGLRRAQALLHSYGITAWQDAWVGPDVTHPDIFGIYLDAAGNGELTARVRGALWWHRDAGPEQIDELVARRRRAGAGPDRFRAGTVKIMQDGVAENFTAGMLAPYRDRCGRATGNAGLSFIDPGLLRGYVTRLDALGFQVHFHALGDRAVREALDAVEAARAANGWTDHRHHLAHLQVVHPQDVPRFRRLGAGANMQPLWAAHEPQMDELTIPFLDAERAGWQYPFAALRQAGATLAAGSDWPVSSANPIEGMHVAVNRVLPGAGAPPFLPAQRLDLPAALAAYTAGAAWVNHLDDTGTIRVGALADLALLDHDPFAEPVSAISETRVLRTYVGGNLVYAAADG
jgi:predicted amidohydrolase YtcJ